MSSEVVEVARGMNEKWKWWAYNVDNLVEDPLLADGVVVSSEWNVLQLIWEVQWAPWGQQESILEKDPTNQGEEEDVWGEVSVEGREEW